MDCIGTWASGDEFCRSDGFRVFLNSLCNVSAEVYFFTHQMPADVRQQLSHYQIVDVDPSQVHFLLRDRHLAYWRFLSSRQRGRWLFVDSKDVIFQRDPFQDLQNDLLFVSEGMTHAQSGWNLIDQYEAQRNVREFGFECRPQPVLNGGIIGGTAAALRDFFFLLWTNIVRATGNCTDQGVLNYLYHYLQNDSRILVANPHQEPFCLTGEAVKEGWIQPTFEDGILGLEAKGSYAILHQWERTIYRNDLLARYR